MESLRAPISREALISKVVLTWVPETKRIPTMGNISNILNFMGQASHCSLLSWLIREGPNQRRIGRLHGRCQARSV